MTIENIPINNSTPNLTHSLTPQYCPHGIELQNGEWICKSALSSSSELIFIAAIFLILLGLKKFIGRKKAEWVMVVLGLIIIIFGNPVAGMIVLTFTAFDSWGFYLRKKYPNSKIIRLIFGKKDI